MKFIKHFSRIVVGLTFMFSGFVKGIDPLGFAYKFKDYFTAMGLDWMIWAALPLSFILAFAEFAIGATLFFNVMVRFVSWLALLFMVFFTGLTFWIALKNPVTDCGCFGDALVITNWQTFYKNVVLIVFAIIIFRYRKDMGSFFGKKVESFLAGLVIAGYVVSVWISFNHLPMFNFRPYKNGVNIPEAMAIPKDAPKSVFENIFYYKNRNSGEIKEFTEQNYPWQDTLNWVFSDMKTKQIKKGYEPPIHNFSMETKDGQNVLDFFLADDKYVLMLIAYDLHKTSIKPQEKINKLAAWAKEKGLSFVCLTATSLEEAQEFGIKNGVTYEFFNCDEITLKTMMRANPGLMLLKKGTIIDQWHHNDIPSPEEFEKKFLNK